MARLFITNRGDVRSAIQDRWRVAGLTFQDLPGDLFAAAARKRRIHHRNLHAKGGEHWLAVTGSYGVLDGSWGGDALAALDDGFSDAAPTELRHRIFGHYGFAIRRGSRAFAFCDPIASYEMFFTERDGSFLVASSLSDCLAAPWVDGTINEPNALVAAFHGERGLGEWSTMAGVRSVRGHQLISMTEKAGQWEAHVVRTPDIRIPSPPAGFGSGVEAYAATTRTMMQGAAKAGHLAVNATGGLDSRLVLAAAGEAGLARHLLYGRGNSALTNTRRQDRLVAHELARYFGANLTLMDWRQEGISSAARRRNLRATHGFKLPYGGTERIIEAFDGGIDPYPDLQLAGYGTGFTNARIWAWEEPVPLRVFAERYAGAYLDVFVDEKGREDYLDCMADDIAGVAKAYGLEEGPDGFEPMAATALWALTKISKESFNINAFNEYAYYLAPHFTSNLLLPLLAVPPEWRRGDRYQIALIMAHDPDILSAPIYSGTRHYVLDHDSGTVKLLEHQYTLSAMLRRGMTRVAEMIEARKDRTRMIRAQLRRELEDLSGTVVDPDRFAQKDARAVFRFIIAREIGADPKG